MSTYPCDTISSCKSFFFRIRTWCNNVELYSFSTIRHQRLIEICWLMANSTCTLLLQTLIFVNKLTSSKMEHFSPGSCSGVVLFFRLTKTSQWFWSGYCKANRSTNTTWPLSQPLGLKHLWKEEKRKTQFPIMDQSKLFVLDLTKDHSWLVVTSVYFN